MKRIVSLIILIAMFSAVCSIGNSAETFNGVVLTAETEGGVAGGELKVTLAVTQNPGFMYMRFSPVYDNSVLTLISATRDGADLSYDPVDFEIGDKNIIVFNNKNIKGTGSLMTLTFAVADVPAGNTGISFDIKECYDSTETDVPAMAESLEAPLYRMTVKVGAGEGVIDGTADITVSVENNSGFCAMELALSFPAFLTLDSVTSDVFADCTFGESVVLGSETDVNSDVVATLHFIISDTAERGEYAITANLVSITGADGSDVVADVASGSLTVGCDHHRTETVNAVAPTCTATGLSGELVCALCGDVLQANQTVPANGHSYGEPVFTWAADHSSATAKFVCAVCGDEQNVDATVSTRTSEPTCTEKGSVTYTASVTFEGTGYSEELPFEIPAKGHSYGEPVFTWAADHSSATAKFVCAVCGDEQNVDATVSTRTSEPTCTEKGSVTYTASVTFEGTEYSEELPFEIPAKGHSYGEPVFTWAADHSSASAEFTCAACGDKQNVNATVISRTTEPTCTEKGSVKYTATVTFEETEYSEEQTVEIPANGHSFTGPVFVWAEDHSSATATFHCENCLAVEAIGAQITSETFVLREDNAYNVTKYTATVEFMGVTYEDEAEVVNFMYGDINGDGVVNGKDLIRLRKYLVGSDVELSGGADCNGDGTVNGKDLIRLRKYLVSEDVSLLGPQ